MPSNALERDGLIFVDVARRLGANPDDLRRAHRRGDLVRVRRGAYCPRERWQMLDDRGRHLLAVRAVARTARPPFLIAGRSAAAVWGMPESAGSADDVTLLIPYRGGGSSGSGVRRTTVGASSAQLNDVDGIPVTTLERTALDVARRLPFEVAVGVLDWAIREDDPTRTTKTALLEDLDRLGAGETTRLRAAVRFADGRAESVGESRTRALIHRLGFAPPKLQLEFSDEAGTMRVDFAWPEVGVVAEFDGKVKFQRDEYTGGDPVETLWREKRREDRLRRQVHRVERIVWAHLEEPMSLRRLLLDAGVPLALGHPKARLDASLQRSIAS